jgi:hypothetical protein
VNHPQNALVEKEGINDCRNDWVLRYLGNASCNIPQQCVVQQEAANYVHADPWSREVKEVEAASSLLEILVCTSFSQQCQGCTKRQAVRFGALEEVFMSYRPHGAWRTMEVLEELA